MSSMSVLNGLEQQWLKGLVNAVQGGVVIADEQGLPRFVSDAAQELLGCAGESSCAEPWRAVHAEIERAGATDVEQTIDIRLATAGRDLDLRANVIPLGSDGRGYVAILRSRSQLRAIELDLTLADRMRGIMTLHRTMAHDLKAPLGVIAISLDLLQRSLNERGGDEEARRERQLRQVRTLQAELTRLQRSLQAYLDQAGGSQAEPTAFDFRRLVREVTAVLGPQMVSQHVRFELRMTERPVNVFGHRDRLRQVVFNLAINALEAMAQGGVLSIDLETEGAQMRLRVHDSGPGTPPELLDRAFEMYVTSKENRSGIGLFVARTTVTDHGGSIRLDSSAGEGTTAEIELPLVHELGGEESADRSTG